MKERYQETFDQVRASDSLRKKIGDIPTQERKKSRRGIPKAILIAAVLAAFLAGTAVAGSFNWIVLEPVEDYMNSGETAYHLNGNIAPLPVDSLPQELLDRAEPQGKYWEPDLYGFDSWSEAEEFLGLELMDNPRLDQMWCPKVWHARPDGVQIRARCRLEVSYRSDGGLPGSVTLRNTYEEDEYYFSVNALLYTDANPDLDRLGYYLEPEAAATMEDYVTPNGLSVSIFTSYFSTFERLTPTTALRATYVTYTAFFAKGNAMFEIITTVNLQGNSWNPAQDPDRAMEIFKEVLDGFQ